MRESPVSVRTCYGSSQHTEGCPRTHDHTLHNSRVKIHYLVLFRSARGVSSDGILYDLMCLLFGFWGRQTCPTYPMLGASSQPQAVRTGKPTQVKTGKLLSGGHRLETREYMPASRKVIISTFHALEKSEVGTSSSAQTITLVQAPVTALITATS